MKLTQSFVKLPLKFDKERLVAEAMQFRDTEWQSHPNRYDGNSAIRLISKDGEENDAIFGSMLPTDSLECCPYIKQVISSFGVVVSRSRLMKLGPHSTVPAHSDINYHWFNRVRIHIPILTNPLVKFLCSSDSVHMEAGEAWIFDNWKIHSVENQSNETRIHLVIDTVGNTEFWNMVRFASNASVKQLDAETKYLEYRYSNSSQLVCEPDSSADILSPNEILHLCEDFHWDIICPEAGNSSAAAEDAFRRAVSALYVRWCILWENFGADSQHISDYRALLDATQAQLKSIPNAIVMKSNGVLASNVFHSRVRVGAVRETVERLNINRPKRARIGYREQFDRPVFIVSAPRAGSTLLFETMSRINGLLSIGGESHQIFEGIAGFNPNRNVVKDNRLLASDATDAICDTIAKAFFFNLKTSSGAHIVPQAGNTLRFLEKTPKNALRIPFIKKLFPTALFIYLYREPRQNVASMMDAWNSGRWITYKNLPERSAPWSLLLPPNWQSVNTAPLEEITAFQWCAANETVMTDLNDISKADFHVVTYGELLNNPLEVMQSVGSFIDLPLDKEYIASLSEPLPNSRYTLRAPDSNKWKQHEMALLRVEKQISNTNLNFEQWRINLCK